MLRCAGSEEVEEFQHELLHSCAVVVGRRQADQRMTEQKHRGLLQSFEVSRLAHLLSRVTLGTSQRTGGLRSVLLLRDRDVPISCFF